MTNDYHRYHQYRSGPSAGDRAHGAAQIGTGLGIVIAMAALALVLIGIGVIALILGAILAPLLMWMTRRWAPGHWIDYTHALFLIACGVVAIVVVLLVTVFGFGMLIEHTTFAQSVERMLAPVESTLLAIEARMYAGQWLAWLHPLVLALFFPLLLPGLAVFSAMLAYDLEAPYRGWKGFQRGMVAGLVLVVAATAVMAGAIAGIMALFAE